MSKKIKNLLIIVILFLAVLIVGILIFKSQFISPVKKSKSGEKIKVVTSFYPLYFLASNIGGEHAKVINITPTGAEPHDYELTPANMVQIVSSKLLILNGGHLEAWGPHIKKIINPKQTILVIASAGLFNRKISEGGQAIVDPHVWLSPVLAQKMVARITQAFSKADPANRIYYQTRASKLKAQLAVLNQEYIKGLSHCVRKDIVTSHAAFGYLAAQYQLKQIAIAGLSPDSEPSPKQLINLVKFIKSQKIKYIFFESLVSPKLADTVANEVGAKILVLNPIEGLTSDELAQGQNYFTEMRSNLVNLQTALECKK